MASRGSDGHDVRDVGDPLPHVVPSGWPAGVIGVGSVRFSGAVVHSMPPRRGASQATGAVAVPSGAMARRIPRRPVAESVTRWPSHGWERCIKPVEVTAAPREEPLPAPFEEEARSDGWGDMVVAFPSRPGTRGCGAAAMPSRQACSI